MIVKTDTWVLPPEDERPNRYKCLGLIGQEWHIVTWATGWNIGLNMRISQWRDEYENLCGSIKRFAPLPPLTEVVE